MKDFTKMFTVFRNRPQCVVLGAVCTCFLLLLLVRQTCNMKDGAKSTRRATVRLALLEGKCDVSPPSNLMYHKTCHFRLIFFCQSFWSESQCESKALHWTNQAFKMATSRL